jgi:hypothetical protein
MQLAQTIGMQKTMLASKLMVLTGKKKSGAFEVILP